MPLKQTTLTLWRVARSTTLMATLLSLDHSNGAHTFWVRRFECGMLARCEQHVHPAAATCCCWLSLRQHVHAAAASSPKTSAWSYGSLPLPLAIKRLDRMGSDRIGSMSPTTATNLARNVRDNIDWCWPNCSTTQLPFTRSFSNSLSCSLQTHKNIF